MPFALHHFGPAHGKPLVLLHGFPMDSRIWNSIIPLLPGDVRVVSIDLFGFGKSLQTEPYSLASGAAELRATLKRERLLPCVLGGLSMGGYVAFSFAHQFPQDLSGLLLIDTKAAADDEAGKQARNDKIEIVRKHGVAAIAAEMLPNLLAPSTLQNNPTVVAELKQIMESSPPLAVEYALAAMRDRADHTATLAEIDVPTLILVGEQDRVTPPAVAAAMKQKIRYSELTIIPEAGHMNPMEQPARVVEAIMKSAMTKPESPNQ